MGMIEDKDIELHIDRETLLQEYIPRKDYERCLKADMVAMLEEIKDEIASNYLIDADTGVIISGTLSNFKAQKLLDSINNEIDKLKGGEDGKIG